MFNNPIRKPIEFKISTLVAFSAILREANLGILKQAMQDMTGGNADFFDDEFTVIDVGALDTTLTIDWVGIVALLKAYRLNAVAVRNASPEILADIVAKGLSIDGSLKPRDAEVNEPEQAKMPLKAPIEVIEAAPVAIEPQVQPAAQALQASATIIVDAPVRAGQRFYARGADLVITAAVNNGAEVIADGSIHVYAPLRGRALAGASGNTEARIFTLSMEAELVSIAGIYHIFENGLPADQARKTIQVRLVGDRIDMLPIRAT